MTIAPNFVAFDTLVLLAMLTIAVVSDMRSRRIPNVLILVGIVSALILHLASFLFDAVALAGNHLWSPVAGLVTGGALLLPLYLLRACGAGDVKLMAMAGAFAGPPTIAVAVLCTLIAGGLLSIVFMMGRGVAAQALSNLRFMATNWFQRASTGQGLRIEPLAQTAARLPYGLAITTGTIAALLLRAGLIG